MKVQYVWFYCIINQSTTQFCSNMKENCVLMWICIVMSIYYFLQSDREWLLHFPYEPQCFSNKQKNVVIYISNTNHVYSCFFFKQKALCVSLNSTKHVECIFFLHNILNPTLDTSYRSSVFLPLLLISVRMWITSPACLCAFASLCVCTI